MSQRLISGLLGCCLMLVAGGIGAAAEPRRELWQLVSKDVGLAVEARGLSGQTRQFLTSELFQRIERHSSWQNLLQSKEAKEFFHVQQTVRDVTKKPLHFWMEKLVGQEALLSIVPQAAGRPQSVLLLRLQNPEDWGEILAAWEELEPRTETRLEHQGQVYFQRSKPQEPAEPVFYALLDDVLVLSDRAESLIPVFDLARETDHRGCIEREPNFQQTMKALNSAAVIRIFIQPAAWAQTREARHPAPTELLGRLVLKAWSHCQGVGVGIRQESGLVTEIVARSDDLVQEPFWVKMVARTSGTPAFLARVPSTALFAFAGRHDIADVVEWTLAQVPPERLKKWKSTRQVVNGFLLGNDLLTEILPQMPADFGGFVVPRENLELDAPPVDGLLAVALPPPASGEAAAQTGKPSVRSSIDNALRTGVSMLAALHNAASDDEVTIEQVDQDGVTVHWIESLGSIRPAYAVATDYFFIASSPQLIRDVLNQPAANTWSADERLKKLRETLLPDASHFVVLQGERMTSFIREHREFLLQQVETFHKLQPDDAAKRLDRLLEWGQLSDAVILAGSLHADHIKLVLVIAVAEVATPKN